MNTPAETSESLRTLSPATPAEAARMVQHAARERRALVAVGGRTSLRYGWPVGQPFDAMSTAAWTKVIDYPAADMTITVESGIKIHDLHTLLKEQGQRLPIDVPEATRATLGGAIATSTAGPGRFGHGTFRDYVIGISAIDGQGRRFSAGGRVVKNVAGYDLCKLLTGSMGTLAIITQLSLKLRPLCESRVIVCLEVSDWSAAQARLHDLLTSKTRPVAIELLNSKAARQLANESRVPLPLDRPVLCVAYEGTPSNVAWQVDMLGLEMGVRGPTVFGEDQVEKLWEALTDYQAASDDPLTFQATLPPSKLSQLMELGTGLGCALQSHAGNGIVIGHLPDRCTSAEHAHEALRPLIKLISQCGGAFSILACEDSWKTTLPVFHPFPTSWRLMQGIKQALDPHGILSPGRIAFPVPSTLAPRP
jgi:glycolate oxidase FAD binding subunit